MTGKTHFELGKDAQWWHCRCIQDIPAEPEHMKGGALKNETGYIAIFETGEVQFWNGKGFTRDFKSVDDARQYFTCIKKSENKAQAIVDAWNSIMY